MHPPIRRISTPRLPHQQPEIPPIEPISAEPLAYPPKPLFPYLAVNISSGSTSPHLVMARNKRTSPPTAKPRRLLTGPRNYAYVFPHTLVSISARSGLRPPLVSISAIHTESVGTGARSGGGRIRRSLLIRHSCERGNPLRHVLRAGPPRDRPDPGFHQRPLHGRGRRPSA